jgi:hypothetical protein
MKIPTIPVSGWVILIGTIMLLVTSVLLLRLYGTVHWGVAQNAAGVENAFEALTKLPDYRLLLKSHESATKLAEILESDVHELREASTKTLFGLEVFRLYSLGTFIVSLLTILCKPRWLALFAVPLGVFALTQSWIIM